MSSISVVFPFFRMAISDPAKANLLDAFSSWEFLVITVLFSGEMLPVVSSTG